MKRVLDAFRGGTVPIGFLVAGVFVAVAGIMGLLVLPDNITSTTDMRIEPQQAVSKVGDNFTVQVIVESPVPVNVFGGEIHFNTDVLAVESIDYNTSIANLWAEKPWYENGAGTLNFGGGTTKEGGFVGVGSLLTITFKTLKEGSGTLSLANARILLHDGLGTDTHIKAPIDAVFTVTTDTTPDTNMVSKTPAGATYTIFRDKPSTDLNGDGKQTIADISMFMVHMRDGDLQYDFNQDGTVGVRDLSIMLQTLGNE